MRYKIGKKEYDITQNVEAARFVELQKYFVQTWNNLEEASKPERAKLVIERDQLAKTLGVPWYKLPRLVREHVSTQYNEM